MEQKKELGLTPEEMQARLEKQDQAITELQDKLKEKKTLKPKKALAKMAKAMFIGNRLVASFGKVGEPEEDGTPVDPETTKLKLQDLNGEVKEERVNYFKLMRENTRFTCEIVSIQKEEELAHQGPYPIEHRAVVADQENFRTSGGAAFTPRTFVLEHTPVTAMAQIKFLEGPWKDKEVSVDISCLNP